MIKLTVSQWRNTGTIDRSIALPPFTDTGDIVIGLAAFREDKDSIELMIDSDRAIYAIACDRILSGAGFMDFLLQVHSKTWVTPQHIHDLLDVITCWTYREHGKFPQMFFDVAGGMNRDMGT